MVDSSCGADVQFELRFNDFTCNTETTSTKADTFEIGINTDAAVVNSKADVPETHDNGTNTDEQTVETLVTKPVTESAERDTRECQNVPLRPLTIETGCDPILLDDCDNLMGQSQRLTTSPWAIVLERNVAVAENEMVSSAIFMNRTLTLPPIRTETEDVACETDFTLYSELSATISNGSFRNASSRCFNEAGCNTTLTQTIDSSSNTDDVTSGQPTPLTIEASCSTDIITTRDVICYTDHVTTKPLMVDSSCGADVQFELRFNDFTCNTETKADTLRLA